MERAIRRLLARYIGHDYDGFVFTAAGTPDPALAFEYSLRQRKKAESSISEFRLEDIMRFPISKEKNGELIVSEMSADDFLLKEDVKAGEGQSGAQSEANQSGAPSEANQSGTQSEVNQSGTQSEDSESQSTTNQNSPSICVAFSLPPITSISAHSIYVNLLNSMLLLRKDVSAFLFDDTRHFSFLCKTQRIRCIREFEW